MPKSRGSWPTPPSGWGWSTTSRITWQSLGSRCPTRRISVSSPRRCRGRSMSGCWGCSEHAACGCRRSWQPPRCETRSPPTRSGRWMPAWPWGSSKSRTRRSSRLRPRSRAPCRSRRRSIGRSWCQTRSAAVRWHSRARRAALDTRSGISTPRCFMSLPSAAAVGWPSGSKPASPAPVARSSRMESRWSTPTRGGS